MLTTLAKTIVNNNNNNLGIADTPININTAVVLLCQYFSSFITFSNVYFFVEKWQNHYSLQRHPENRFPTLWPPS